MSCTAMNQIYVFIYHFVGVLKYMFCPVFCLTAAGVAHVEEKVYFKCLTVVILCRRFNWTVKSSDISTSNQHRSQHRSSHTRIHIIMCLTCVLLIFFYNYLFIYNYTAEEKLFVLFLLRKIDVIGILF